MSRWAVVCIDWKPPNVICWVEDRDDARQVADMYDGLALRAIALPEGDPRIKEVPNASAH